MRTNYNNELIQNIIITLVAFAIGAGFLILIHSNYEATHYTNCAVVETVAEDNVVLVDCLGDEWIVKNVPNAKEGDLVNVLFYSNRTPQTHNDDIVINVSVIK